MMVVVMIIETEFVQRCKRDVMNDRHDYDC